MIKLEESAVIVPIYFDDKKDLILVLIRRSPGGIHGGQIAFPGGRRDKSDISLLDTALREVEEEIGLARNHVEVIETLPDVVTSSLRYRIRPFLAKITRPKEWKLSVEEVAEVIEVPVHTLPNLESPGNPSGRLDPEFDPFTYPHFKIGMYPLWGATHRIVKPLVPRLLATQMLKEIG